LVGGIPIGLIALTVGTSQLAWALVLYTLIQWLEGFVLAPLVQQRVVALAPALALAAQVILGILFGFIGIVISVPLAAIVVVAVKRIYVEGFLGGAARRQLERISKTLSVSWRSPIAFAKSCEETRAAIAGMIKHRDGADQRAVGDRRAVDPAAAASTRR
jgi:hypothetical protein